MPQVKEPLLRKLIKEALKEAELTAGPENTKFSINVDVGNPQSETKLGVRIQLRPKEGFLEPDKRDQLSVAIMKKLNSSLGKYDIQISKDTDVPDPEVLGFFIPLSQLKNMIINTLKRPSQDSEEEPDTPASDDRPTSQMQKPPLPPNMASSPDEDDLTEQEDPMDKWKTGISLKRSNYGNEIGGQLPANELYEKIEVVKDLLTEIFKDIYESDYEFKDYYIRNEEHVSRTQAIIELIQDELEDRIQQQEPVGPDQGLKVEALKHIVAQLVKEQSTKKKSKDELISQAQNFETNQPEKYQEIVDKYIAQGGRPEDVGQYKMPWLFFIDKWIGPYPTPGNNWWDDIGPVENKNTRKKLNEMRQRDLNEISKVVVKEDFYSFINAGNNVLRTLEERGIQNGKKYLGYLVKHNIM